jgi:hypothetical protein
MRKFVLETGLTLTQVVQLRGIVGELSCLTELYGEVTCILKKEGILGKVSLTSYITNNFINHTGYQNACERMVAGSSRTTVTIGGKKYYEDELATALASIKEVKS